MANCPRCGKPVYFNEQVLAAGKSWHKSCFRCTGCSKSLDSSTVAEHDGKLYCKTCHGRQFGPAGYGYGQGAGVLSTDRKPATQTSNTGAGRGPTGASAGGAPVAGGCPRCGKRVYAAEKVIACGKDWHKSCFRCRECNKGLDSTTVTDKDGEIYCKGCYGRKFGPKGVGYGLGAGALTTT